MQENGKSNITNGDQQNLRKSGERMFPHDESNGQDIYDRSAK